MRARIARIMLGEPASARSVGAISLQPHQLTAVARIESALDEFGGALLCDEVGMGKTFVATAVARRFSRRLVVAPAALTSMWRDALAITKTNADLISFEKLSRIGGILAPDLGAESAKLSASAACDCCDLVIVDEAHHARNPATRRYEQLTKLTREARVLLLTATPVHNRTADMLALLTLFLGSRARRLTAGEIAQCVIRREHAQLERSAGIPKVLPVASHEISDEPGIVSGLMNLPPPIPVRDGGLGGTLIARGLVHQWASSEAALHEALRRRIAKASALIASLEGGTYPTEKELRTWVYEDGALQLGFPELLSAPIDDPATLLQAVRLHSNALHEFRSRYSARSALDAERTQILFAIRDAHPNAKIVAFAQYGDTVSMFFRRLVKAGRVAMLTAHGACIAGGKLSREDALARFAPRAFHARPPAPAEEINLLLAADLLSEGVNLQDAEVVVHLDVPWTAARLEQRVGRVARMGSPHSAVSVYLIRPPASAAALLDSEWLVQRKWNAAKGAIGSSVAAPFAHRGHEHEHDERAVSVPEKTERLRTILESWRGPIASRPGYSMTAREDESCRGAEISVASVGADQAGFVAAASADGKPIVIACLDDDVSTEVDSQIAAWLLANGEEVETDLIEYESAVAQIQRWFDNESATAIAGIASSGPLNRKRLLNRIDAIVESAPPHLRTSRSALAASVRRIATAQHGAAIEKELESLAHSPLPDDEWLHAIATLQSATTRGSELRSELQSLQIHALILLNQRHH